MKLDQDGQPNPAFNFAQNEIKAINTLYGLCMGIIADGKVTDQEILFLDTWLKDNQTFLNNYPLNIVHQRIQRILDDGLITQEECQDLYEMLSQMVGGSPIETGITGGLSNQLPTEKIETIDFKNKQFCFTGKFIYGQRSHCEQAVIEKGAQTKNTLTKDIDYLVIGDLASRDWVATSHGRKIEKALLYKDQGSPILIISEQDWVKFI